MGLAVHRTEDMDGYKTAHGVLSFDKGDFLRQFKESYIEEKLAEHIGDDVQEFSVVDITESGEVRAPGIITIGPMPVYKQRQDRQATKEGIRQAEQAISIPVEVDDLDGNTFSKNSIMRDDPAVEGKTEWADYEVFLQLTFSPTTVTSVVDVSPASLGAGGDWLDLDRA